MNHVEDIFPHFIAMAARKRTNATTARQQRAVIILNNTYYS